MMYSPRRKDFLLLVHHERAELEGGGGHCEDGGDRSGVEVLEDEAGLAEQVGLIEDEGVHLVGALRLPALHQDQARFAQGCRHS